MNSLKPVTQYFARYIGFIVLGIMTVIGGIVIWKYIVPKYQEIQITRAEIDSLRTNRDTLTTYVAYLHELENTTLALEKELVNYAIPSENDVISLIVTYEGLSKIPDVSVSSFDLSPGLISSGKDSEENTTDVAIRAGEPPAAGVEQSGTESKELEFKMEVKVEDPQVALDFISKIHQTRRVFTIKNLNWQNPVDEGNSDDDQNITLLIEIGTRYYPSNPQISGSADLVNRGKEQGDFIAKLNNTTVYDALVLDTVPVGKDDMFTFENSGVTPTPRPNPTSILEDDVTVQDVELNPSPTNGVAPITQPQVAF